MRRSGAAVVLLVVLSASALLSGTRQRKPFAARVHVQSRGRGPGDASRARDAPALEGQAQPSLRESTLERSASSRRAISSRTCAATAGISRSIHLNAAPVRTSRRIGELATTDAVRRSASSSPISPKKSPGPSAAMGAPSPGTSAVPSSMTKNSYAKRPWVASCLPAGTSISSACWATNLSWSGVSDENSATDFSSCGSMAHPRQRPRGGATHRPRAAHDSETTRIAMAPRMAAGRRSSSDSVVPPGRSKLSLTLKQEARSIIQTRGRHDGSERRLDGQPRRRLRQRRHRELLRQTEHGADPLALLADAARADRQGLRPHRSVLRPHAPALDARLPLAGTVSELGAQARKNDQHAERDLTN